MNDRTPSLPRIVPVLRKFLAPSLAMLLSLTLANHASAETHHKKKKSKAKVVKLDTVGEYAHFANWKEVIPFIDMMVEQHGFERQALEAVLNKARLLDSAVQLIKPAPPGKPKNWQLYRARFVEPQRIKAGVAFWNTYADALARAEARYGVPADIIVGIIGVETIYGRNTGDFRVMDTLTTLAFAYPETPNRSARMNMFRSELEQTLLYARESHIDPFSLNGSYAGAVGLPQFMPSNLRKYAVDFDGDGQIDLRNSAVDAIGSVAHFLREHGWQNAGPTAYPVKVSLTDAEGRAPWNMFIGQGLQAKFRLDELRSGGVTPQGEVLADIPYGLVDLQNGAEATEYWLGAANFFTITQYNRSYFYAMSVIDLAQAVKSARDK